MVTSYTEHPAGPGLSPYVSCFWVREVAGNFRGLHPVLPDGCIDLLFKQAAGSLKVVGTMTRTLWAEDCGPDRLVGIRFRPGGAVPFLRDHADLLTDGSAEADAVFGLAGTDLKLRLLDSESPASQIRQLERFLLTRLQIDNAVNMPIARATSRLVDDPGLQVDRLARELGLSRQYLRRLFLRHTGLSPKVFARVARLGRLADLLQCGAPLAEAALACGYTDQAHMCHEFREMVGITPTAYRTRRCGSIPTSTAQAGDV